MVIQSVELREVKLDLLEEINLEEVKLVPSFEMATSFLPTGGEIYKVVKYLDLSANIEIVLVCITIINVLG